MNNSITKLFTIIIMLVFVAQTYALTALPKDVTSLDSKAGIALLDTAKFKDKAEVFKLFDNFITEKGLAYCGVASVVMVLNALGLSPDIAPEHTPYAIYTQDNVFYNDKLMNKEHISPMFVMYRGLNLDQMAKIINAQPKAHATEVFGSDIASVDQLRSQLLSAYHDGQYIILNFNRSIVHERGWGHFSPLAAYNAKEDKWLLLDVARYKYPPTWMSSEQVYQSIQGIDSSSKKSRGFLLVTKQGGG